MPKRNLLLLLLVITASCTLAQKKNLDNALLWKVTGNNLSKPSFLYGTIHVQDKRVFNFSDSLYAAIKSADGFAMEIHPDSVVSAIMQKVNEEATEKYVKKYLKKDEYDELNTKFRKEFGFDADRLTVRETYMLRQHLARPERRPDDMPTIVDAYLYGVAKNQGKEIAGLERAIDQVNMMNDLDVGDIDVKKVLKNLKKEQSLIDKFIQLYIKEDLKGIGDLMSYLPDKTEDKLLNLRNHLMVQRMDSLMQLKSFVVAVGSAHLPGEQGMIALLRQKGYTVQPVSTTSRTHANSYFIKAQEQMQWVEVKEPSLGYSARMPGKPSPMEMLNGVMKMNMYMDLTSMKQYYTAFVLPAVSISSHNADSVLQGLYRNMVTASKGEGVSEKRFTRGDFEAIDMLYKIPSDNLHARVQSFAYGKRVYLIGMGAPKQEDLYGKEATAYFEAFTIEKMPEQLWQTHTFNEHYFSVLMPGTPKSSEVPGADTSVSAIQFSGIDESKGSYYAVIAATTNPGFVIPDDSSYFASALQRLNTTIDIRELQQKDTLVQGFPAKWISASLRQDGLMKCLMINRGNRLYSLLMTGSEDDRNSEAVANFFRSFSFMEYPALSWSRQHFADLGFTVPMPGSFSKVDFAGTYAKDKPAAEREYVWSGYDSVSATTFMITRKNVSPYLWAKHDSIVLKKFMKEYAYYTGDVLDYVNLKQRMYSWGVNREVVREYRFITNGNVRGIEFLVDRPNSSHTKYVRILLSGKSRYELEANVPHQYWKEYDFEKFLQGFRIMKEEKTDYLYNNSLQTLLNDLNSTDPDIYSGAYYAINDLIYDSTDLPALIAAGSVSYPLDSMEHFSAGSKFLNIARKMNHVNFDDMVVKHYNELKPGMEKMKYGLLELLAKRYNSRSYLLIGELLGKGLPTSGKVLGFVHGLEDSLALTRKLYPQLLSFSSDSLLGTPLFSIHHLMLERNMISINDIKQFEPAILKAANNELEWIAKNRSDYYYSVGMKDLFYVLGQLQSHASINLLRKFLQCKYLSIQYDAATELIRIGQAIDPAILLALAADNMYRVSLYEELQKKGVQNVFPVKYLNQKAFAEAYLEDARDELSFSANFIGEKVVPYKGTRKKFYLYKVTIGDDGDKYSYLGISGPFDLDEKKLLLSKDHISGIYEEEEFSKSAIDRHFRLYMLQFEEEETIRIGTLPDEKRD